jgi:hypothetical protein
MFKKLRKELKELKEALILYNVSNRRELFISFLNDTKKELGHRKINDIYTEATVDSFIKRKL